MKASLTDNKLPDLGLLAQGYKFAVEGQGKRLLLNSWDSHDHRTAKEILFKDIDFKLEPDIWYTLKLKAANIDDKARVQAKVWPREAKEPADWMIEILDAMPNKQGSPGLFGNATNAEIFIDNVSVVENK